MDGAESGRADASWWSLQPVKDAAPPPVKAVEWVKSPIDHFILAKLEEAGLKPSPRAEAGALIRRLTYDLTGLPPKPAEARAFIEAAERDFGQAMSDAVDRLLASRHYGERWGRHWLDVARYADTAGESADYPVPDAYRYRNYVIDALNRDLPYDQFLKEQIAGDLLPAASDEERWRQTVATGFIAVSRRFGVDPDTTMHQTLEDTIDTLGRAAMGLSMSCARCHDHKFDPVSMRDYYAMYGIFSSTRYPFPGSENKKRPRDLVPLMSEADYKAAMAPFQPDLEALDAEARELESRRGKAVGDKPALTNLQFLELFRGVRARRDALQDKLPALPMAYAVADAEPRHARIQKRGEPFNLGEEVPRGFLEVLGGQQVPSDEKGSGRRELAEWIASPHNPLTARVMANRVWQHHFGRGLVATPNDFGKMGQPPSHPELLDWLAARFVEDGWSVKKLHRRILLSAAWQQAVMQEKEAPVLSEKPARPENSGLVPVLDAVAKPRRQPQEVDPANTLLWSFPRLRLDAEMTRDALLYVSGQLDPTVGGPHPFPPQKEWGWTQHSPFFATYETNERSVYVMQQRIRRHPFFAVFDGADTNASTGSRFISTTPLQALFMMNDPFAHQQAEGFARRVLAAEPAHDTRRVSLAHWLAYGREATVQETSLAITYLASIRARVPENQRAQAEALAWASYARALLGANEFVYLD